MQPNRSGRIAHGDFHEATFYFAHSIRLEDMAFVKADLLWK
jgi:hypothetical protein